MAYNVGRATGTVWTGAGNLSRNGIRFPDRPAPSELLYWLTSTMEFFEHGFYASCFPCYPFYLHSGFSYITILLTIFSFPHRRHLHVHSLFCVFFLFVKNVISWSAESVHTECENRMNSLNISLPFSFTGFQVKSKHRQNISFWEWSPSKALFLSTWYSRDFSSFENIMKKKNWRSTSLFVAYVGYLFRFPTEPL
jgi:hypothetical protein